MTWWGVMSAVAVGLAVGHLLYDIADELLADAAERFHLWI